MNGAGAGPGIGRRQFLKAAAVFLGFLGGGMSGFAGAMERGRKGATGDLRVIGCGSDAPAGGYFNGSLPPVLRIRSGDTVTVETGAHPAGGMIPAARAGDGPEARFSCGRAHLAGPIHVEGAEPGDILQVEILELADDFTKGRVEWCRVRSSPGASGAQLPDEGERIDGTVLHLPVRVKGAGVVTGEIRFAQADGEADAGAPKGGCRRITLRMTVRKELKKGGRPCFPGQGRWIALGIRADRNEARGMAIRRAIRFLDAADAVPDDEGYAFCSMGAERHVTQYVKRHAIATCYASVSCSAK